MEKLSQVLVIIGLVIATYTIGIWLQLLAFIFFTKPFDFENYSTISWIFQIAWWIITFLVGIFVGIYTVRSYTSIAFMFHMFGCITIAGLMTMLSLYLWPFFDFESISTGDWWLYRIDFWIIVSLSVSLSFFLCFELPYISFSKKKKKRLF